MKLCGIIMIGDDIGDGVRTRNTKQRHRRDS